MRSNHTNKWQKSAAVASVNQALQALFAPIFRDKGLAGPKTQWPAKLKAPTACEGLGSGISRAKLLVLPEEICPRSAQKNDPETEPRRHPLEKISLGSSPVPGSSSGVMVLLKPKLKK